MTSQISIGAILEIGNGKSIVVTADSPKTISTPKGYTALIDPALNDQGVAILANGKIKFPKSHTLLMALVTVDPKFKQVRVEALELDALNTMFIEGYTNSIPRITAFLEGLPENSPTVNLINRLDSINTALLQQFWADLMDKMVDIDLEAISAELTALAQKDDQDKQLPDSTTDEDE